MKQKFILAFLTMLICMGGMGVGAQNNERLSFGVISDIHFDNRVGEGAMVKVPKALKNLTSHKALDALAVVGDLADSGAASQYEMLTSVFSDKANFTNPVGTFLFMMGNHDNFDANGKSNFQEGLKSFNGGEPYPLHSYRVIKGYPFITISMSAGGSNDVSNSSTGKAAYPDDVVNQLDAWLAQASNECRGKPIFVFTHIPPRWSVYGSWSEYETGSSWSMSVLNPVLNKYPQAVVFAGHSHYPLGDPRSIHQGTNPESAHQNYFTVINTASTTYSEINPGAVSAGIHPEGYAYVTEGMIVSELENGDIDICRYDTYRNLEIGAEKHWVLKAPFDGSKFEYADIRDANDNPNNVALRDGMPAPVFSKSAAITLDVSDFDAVATFPQATDNDCVFRYRVRVSKDGLVVTEKYIFSQFYLNTDKPKSLSYTIQNLVSNATYNVEVVAFDSYDNASTPLTATFKAPTIDESKIPDADGQWKFEDKNDLLKVEKGDMSLVPCLVGNKSISTAESVTEANITSVDGPTASNKAIVVPKSSALKAVRVNKEATQNYTIMMDIKVADANSYNGLIQTNASNSNDADLFYAKNKIGMNAMGGYFGEIKNNTWYRVVMVNRDGKVTVYVDGENLINTGGDLRWELDPWGFYLFCDEDGEMVDTEVAEIAYWERGLSENQIRSLSGLDPINNDQDPYITVKTSSVKILDGLDFSIKIDANTSFTFDLPDWIEAVDVTPFAGEKAYTFRAKSMDASGRREGTITVKSNSLESQDIQVTQIFLGKDIPEALGVWTFDNRSDLLHGEGTAVLEGAFNTSEGPQKRQNLEITGLKASEGGGPTESNGAIFVPKNAYLWLTTNASTEVLSDYTVMFDIKLADLNGYKALFQNDITNKDDAGLFFKNNQVGLGATLGYHGNLQAGQWYRLLYVVKDGRAILYLDGEKLGEAGNANAKWPINKEALLFADDSNGDEEGPLDVAEIRFWDLPLSDAQAKRLGDVYKDADEYFVVQTPSVRLINENEFTISVKSNVPVYFELPEWIEAVDDQFVEGEKAYKFRTKDMDEPGRREDVIGVYSDYFSPEAVNVFQILMGADVPESSGWWTFDDSSDLMAGTGTATIQAAFKTEEGPATTNNPEEAGITPIEGPLEGNGAVTMPVEAYLMLSTNQDVPEMKDYTIMMDIKPGDLTGYHALFQTNPLNTTDGSFFTKGNSIGLNNFDLGYHGIMEEGKWHRVVFVVKEGYAYSYLDGKKVGQSSKPGGSLWTLLPKALFFADNNDEDGYNEVAELRFWDVPLTDAHVQQLGGVAQNWEDEPIEDPVSVWTFDDASDLLAGTGEAELKAAVKGESGPEETDIETAGLVSVNGPKNGNGAITVPIDTYLQMAHNQDGDQETFTIMMDIRPKSLAGYNALFQSDVDNANDADLFLNKTRLGINTGGLGYGGTVVEGKWHRIVFVVDECNITTYIDGEKVGSSSSPSAEKWTLRDVAYFFADEDGEEGAVDIAELRYWDVALSGVHVNQLGAVEYARADVNRDGVVDSAAIVAVIKEMPDGDMKADVNGDTVIDSADIVAVIKEMK